MSRIPASLTRAVVRRAKGRCEYCRLSQDGQEATFHVDHVVPLASDGPTTLDNLALACVSCSLRKGAKQSAHDAVSGTTVPLFDPRRQRWLEHFVWEGARAVGMTATGRATIGALALNRPLVVAIRGEETILGRHPPAGSKPEEG